MKRLYAIRGAVCALNTKESICEETVKMCELLFSKNAVQSEDLVSIHFTMTRDLDAANPCFCLRSAYKGIDVSNVALFSSQESFVQGSLDHVIRIMVHVYLEEGTELSHIYIDGAEKLRPDFARK